MIVQPGRPPSIGSGQAEWGRITKKSVIAAGIENRKDTEIRVGKDPALRLPSGNSGDAHDHAQMLAARGAVEVVQANPSEPGNFLISEQFLIRFNCDHFPTIPGPNAAAQVQSRITALAQSDEFIEQESCRLKFQLFARQANSQINPIKGFREKTYCFTFPRTGTIEIPN